MVILDTNIIIDHLRQTGSKDSILSKLLKESKLDEVVISSVTIQELFEGQSTKEEEIGKWILAILSPFKLLPYTYEIAKLAGEVARDLDRDMEFADAAIAATAIAHGAKLATLNKKDFRGIQGLELV